jgi:hypothetical protein
MAEIILAPGATPPLALAIEETEATPAESPTQTGANHKTPSGSR